MNQHQPTLIKNLLNNPHSTLSLTLKKASALKQLNDIFQKTLNSELAKHCCLVEINEKSITLIVDNASWATALRYAIPDIIKTLKTKSPFKNLKDIHYRCDKK